ncbi:MAG: late competence development ComFB family protein [Spirochaetia bacterium]|jgi:hypothetical protein
MRLKNYNEDLVLDTAKIVLRDRQDVRVNRSFLLDVAAYVLNRIPPKYITSERGFTREFVAAAAAGEDGRRLVSVIELITLVNRAVEVVARRRRNGFPAHPRRPEATEASDDEARLTYFYNMPHIFGRIVDAGDGRPVISAEATLWINDKMAVPAETGWRNPCFTNEQTGGYFSFWPAVETGESDSMRIQMRIAFEHDGHQPLSFRKTMKVPGEFFVYDYIRGDKLLDVGTLSMQPSQ